MFKLINEKGKLKAKVYTESYRMANGSAILNLHWNGGVLSFSEEFPEPKMYPPPEKPKLDKKFKPEPAYKGAK